MILSILHSKAVGVHGPVDGIEAMDSASLFLPSPSSFPVSPFSSTPILVFPYHQSRQVGVTVLEAVTFFVRCLVHMTYESWMTSHHEQWVLLLPTKSSPCLLVGMVLTCTGVSFSPVSVSGSPAPLQHKTWEVRDMPRGPGRAHPPTDFLQPWSSPPPFNSISSFCLLPRSGTWRA